MKIGKGLVVLFAFPLLTAIPLPSHSACQSGTSSVSLTVDVNGEVRTGTNTVSLNDVDGGGNKIAHQYPGGITIAPLNSAKGDARVIGGNDCNLDKLSLENAKITVTSGATVPISNYPITFWGTFATPPDSTTQTVWYQLWGYGDIMFGANQAGRDDEIKATAWILNPISTGSDQPSDNSFYLNKRITCYTPLATCKLFFNPNKISWAWPDATLAGDRRLKVQVLLKTITRSTDVVSIYGGDAGVDNGIFLKSSDTPGLDCKDIPHRKKVKHCK